MKKTPLGITVLFLLPILFCGQSPPSKELDVPYTATPYPIVEKMLTIADVQKDDIVYDLGCGDGRINILAAKKFGAAGLGVDLDRSLIKECRKKAAASGVDHLVSFQEQDLFETDLSSATIVTLYLYESVNFQLRPRLLNQLQPGSRIVSHNFGMKEWHPDHISFHVNDDDSHLLYAWIVPANVGGTWNCEQKGTDKLLFKLRIDQTFQLISGIIIQKDKEYEITTADLQGNKISFTLEQSLGQDILAWKMTGRTNGHVMEGKCTPIDHSDIAEFAWKAWREPASARPLDALKLEF